MQNKWIKNPKTKQIYRMWHGAMSRCNNPNNPHYKDYGGRGIKVCKRWHKFENFLSDEYEAYDAHRQLVGNHRKDLSIDRINNNRNYEPGNIRYVSQKVQCNNKRPGNDKFFTYEGQTKNISQWAEILPIKYVTLLWRLNNDWSVEKALSIPIDKKFKPKK